MRTDVEALHRRLMALPPAQRLLIAAQLMEAGEGDLSVAIAENVVLEWQAAQLCSGKPAES